MAENKKSVLLYCDLIHTVEKMDDATAGEFFKHYLRYINDLNPESDNPIVDITFESVKQNLKRDLVKWEQRAEKSRMNGKLGGRPKTQITQQVKLKPRKPDTVTVTDKVTVKDTVNVIKDKEAVFKKTLLNFQDKYDVNLLKEFFYYWTEKGDNGKKMRFELSKNQPFNTARRLSTWKKNESKYGTPKTTTESRQEMNRALFNEAIKN